jgi:hypothetical protein
MRCKKIQKKLTKPKAMDSITDRGVGPLHLRSIRKGRLKKRFNKRCFCRAFCFVVFCVAVQVRDRQTVNYNCPLEGMVDIIFSNKYNRYTNDTVCDEPVAEKMGREIITIDLYGGGKRVVYGFSM